MLVNVIEAKYLDGYRIAVTFNDGRSGVADLTDALNGPVFEPLKDEREFRKFTVDNELDTIVWPNGADVAPEYVFYKAFKNDADLQEQFKDWGYLGR
jgi:hypothetical protein